MAIFFSLIKKYEEISSKDTRSQDQTINKNSKHCSDKMCTFNVMALLTDAMI